MGGGVPPALGEVVVVVAVLWTVGPRAQEGHAPVLPLPLSLGQHLLVHVRSLERRRGRRRGRHLTRKVQGALQSGRGQVLGVVTM